jgi:hypothetical protein
MAFTGKDPKDTFLAILNIGDANQALQPIATTPVLDAGGLASLLELSQSVVIFTGILTANVANGLVMDAGIPLVADAVTVDSVLDKTDTDVGIFFTTGDPEGSLTASVGSMALRRDGVAGATMFVKESGAGNTGWATFDFVNTFLGLVDTPGTYIADKWVKVNGAGTGLILTDAPVVSIGAFTELTDVPYPDYVGHGGKTLRIHASETYLEFVPYPAGSFIGLTDTPGAFVAEKWLKVNAGGTALEFVDSPAGSLIGHSDTPSSYAGEGGKILVVNVAEDAMEFAAHTFLTLSDTPGTYSANQYVRVNAGGTGLEFAANPLPGGVQGDILYYTGIAWSALSPGTAGQHLTTGGPAANPSWTTPVTTFLALTDVPATFVGQAGKTVQVNVGETALEFVAFPTGTFVGLSDTPSAFTGQAGKTVQVNVGESALEFVAFPAGTFIGQSDTPTDYTGDGGKFLAVNVGEDAVEFVAAPAGTFIGHSDTPADYTGDAGKLLIVNSTPDAVDFLGGIQGDVLYHNGSAWTALGVGTSGQFLKTQGAAANPVWDNVPDPFPSGVQGDILYHNGSAWVVLPPGTTGYVLATQGAAANPVWAAAGIGGVTTWLGLTDTPASYPTDYVFSFPSVNAAEDALEFPPAPLCELPAYAPFTPVGIMAYIDADIGGWLPIYSPFPAGDPSPRVYLVMDPSNDPNDFPAGPGIVGGTPTWDVLQVTVGEIQGNENVLTSNDYDIPYVLAGVYYYASIGSMLQTPPVVPVAPTNGQVLSFNFGTGQIEWITLGNKYYDRVREPVTNGNPTTPEILFDTNGDVVMVEYTTEYTTHV